MKHKTKLIIASLLATLFHGYQFAVSDQEIVIPYILKYADKSLFAQDMLFNQPSANLSIFYPLFGFFSKFFNIELIFFISYIIFHFTFFSAIYRLSKAVLKDQNLAYFSIFPFLLPKFIGGTATQTFDLFFGYRSIGIIFLIFYLTYLIEKKFTKSLVWAFAGMLFHPLSIVPSLPLLPALLFKNAKYKFLLALATFWILAVSLALASLGGEYISNIFTRDDLWHSIIQNRNDYLFPSSWTIRAWGALLIYFFIIGILLNQINKNLKGQIILISLTSLAVFILSSLILEYLKIASIAQLQLVRSISPVAYISLCLSPLFLVFKNPVQKILGISAFVLLSLNLFDIFAIVTVLFVITLLTLRVQKRKVSTSVFYLVLLPVALFFLINVNTLSKLQNKAQFPKGDTDWISAQKWSHAYTQKSAKFLVPPDRTGFRIFSQRPIIGDIKDGAVVIYSRSYAYYWLSLMNDLRDFNNKGEEDFKELKDKYNFDYLVISSDSDLDISPVYQNNTYKIFKL